MRELLMRALVITGSRADCNGLEVVHEALLKAGHKSQFMQWNLSVIRACAEADVAILGSDRFEILEAAVEITGMDVPIAHIAGGDVTEGSADNRYRDAITALSCIHFATNEDAYLRLTQHLARHSDDRVYHTGSPAIDRIYQTAITVKDELWRQLGFWPDGPVALVCVHPNTVGKDPTADFAAVEHALHKLDLCCVLLGANADNGGAAINTMWQALAKQSSKVTFHDNVSPQLYYSLMKYCDVMIGNSSAMLYEAPSFGLPCVLVGDRQKGRSIPNNVVAQTKLDAEHVRAGIRAALMYGRHKCNNPYGDGKSAPRIVKALEQNVWRRLSEELEVCHVKHVRAFS
jgi:UDP-hydrolysing UDP-N-acetyl-D-glucosamine 2-epimerase